MGKPVRRFFCMQKYVVEHAALDRGTPKRGSLYRSDPPTVVRLVPFLSGQLLGGFAEPFHCFQILPHGFHGKRVRRLSSGQLIYFPLPCLRGDCLAVVFQFFQIPGRCVIEDQFPAVALLKLFPLFRLYFTSCLWMALYWLYCSHISPRSVRVAIRRSALTIFPRRS